MLEERTTHHLVTLQVRVASPVGPAAHAPGAADQDLYHVIATSAAIKRLRDVCERLRRSIARGECMTVAETIQHLGDRVGGSPGIAAYRAVAIDGGTDDTTGEDIWLAPSDRVRRFLLLEYTRFWPIPIEEPEYTLVELEQGVRDRPLFTLERAIERRGAHPAMMWRCDNHYIGLGYRCSARERRSFVDRPLDASSEIRAIQEMGLTPVAADARWSRRALRSVAGIAGLA